MTRHDHDYGSLRGGETIAVDVPAHVTFRSVTPVAVFGFLDVGDHLDRASPVEAWADYNCLGAVSQAGQHTLRLELLEGEHVLHAHCAMPQGTRRFVWSVSAVGPAAGDAARAAPSNTAVLTIGSYPEAELFEVTRLPSLTASRQGISRRVLGVSLPYGSFATKVQAMRGWVRSLPRRFRYVLYADANDTLFQSPLAAICDGFNRAGKPVLISAENCCWPVRTAEWAERFPPHPWDRRWPCAGVWMGERDAVERTLDTLIDLRGRIAASDPSLRAFLPYGNHITDDQFLWQVAMLSGGAPVTPDYSCDICFNVACSGTEIQGNKFFDFASGTVRDTGTRPGILHFSSAAKRGRHHEHWARALGMWDGTPSPVAPQTCRTDLPVTPNQGA
jgi:hypothetical protein